MYSCCISHRCKVLLWLLENLPITPTSHSFAKLAEQRNFGAGAWLKLWEVQRRGRRYLVSVETRVRPVTKCKTKTCRYLLTDSGDVQWKSAENWRSGLNGFFLISYPPAT